MVKVHNTKISKILQNYQHRTLKLASELTYGSVTKGFKSNVGPKWILLSIFCPTKYDPNLFKWIVSTKGALWMVSCLWALTFCLHCWQLYCFSPPSNCSLAVKWVSALHKESALIISRLKSINGSNLLEEKEHCVHFTWNKYQQGKFKNQEGRE